MTSIVNMKRPVIITNICMLTKITITVVTTTSIFVVAVVVIIIVIVITKKGGKTPMAPRVKALTAEQINSAEYARTKPSLRKADSTHGQLKPFDLHWTINNTALAKMHSAEHKQECIGQG